MKHESDFLEQLWAHERTQVARKLEQMLQMYGTAPSPDEAVEILNRLPSSYFHCPLTPGFDADGFFSRIVSNVTKTRVRIEFQSGIFTIRPVPSQSDSAEDYASSPPRPPFNAEYVLYFVLRREERDEVIGDLIEAYGNVLKRFTKRRADIWFYQQVFASVLPLLRQTLLRIGALVWLGRVLRRLIS